MNGDQQAPRSRARPARALSGLERWLQEWAVHEGVAAGRLRRYVMVLVVAAMLDAVRDTEDEPRFLLKGGTSLELRFGHRARASRDLDTVFRGELDDAIALVEQAVARGWMDTFGGRITGVSEVNVPGLRVKPRRFEVKLTYRGRPFGTLPMEVSPPEGKTADEYDVVEVRPLAPVGLEAPQDVPCLALRYQVAQKLHACTDRLDGGRLNDRARDLADLIVIDQLALAELDLAPVREACVEIFGGRARHSWPPAIEVFPGWDALWADIVLDEDFPVEDIGEACALVRDLVNRIDAARR